MMKRVKSKAELRAELAQEMESYLSDGGAVENIPVGTSGNTANVNLFRVATNFEPKKERTLVTEVIKDLDSRKKNKSVPIKKLRSPRKKLLTDDFGEPIRWIWSEWGPSQGNYCSPLFGDYTIRSYPVRNGS